MNTNLSLFLKEYLPNLDIEEEKIKYAKFQEWDFVKNEKLPKIHNFKYFVDSDGSRIFQEDIKTKLEVDYENILFSLFQGFSLATESNQFPLFSSMFTSAKSTYQIYNKNSRSAFTQFEGTIATKHKKYNRVPYKKYFDVCVSRGSGALIVRNDKLMRNNNNIFTLQPLWEHDQGGLPGRVFNNKYLLKAPAPYLSSFFIKNIDNIKRRNFIMFASTVDAMNNQLEFAKMIDPDVVKNHKILFCGLIKDKQLNYANKICKVLDKKEIQYIFLDRVPHYILCHLYLMSKIIVRYATVDYGPRCLSEGIWAGLPFVTNNNVIMPDELMKFGTSCRLNDKLTLNDEILKSLNYNNHKDIHLYCKENFSLRKLFTKNILDINTLYNHSRD